MWRSTTASGPVIVRFCPTRFDSYERETRVLRSLEGSGLPIPRILGENDEHRVLVMTDLPGDTACPTDDPRAVVTASARVLAALHRQDPNSSLPVAVEPTPRQMRAWAARNHDAHELHQIARRREREAAPEQVVLVHGDYWTGNLLWSGATVTGVVDWERSGPGHRGQDVAKMRLDLTMLFGLDAATWFRDEYETLAGIQVPNADYWDVRVAVDGYPDPGRWWLPTYQQLGHTHLNADLVRRRFTTYVQSITATTP